MGPIIACARRLLPHARLAVVGYQGVADTTWTRELRRASARDGVRFDAVSIHVYSVRRGGFLKPWV